MQSCVALIQLLLLLSTDISGKLRLHCSLSLTKGSVKHKYLQHGLRPHSSSMCKHAELCGGGWLLAHCGGQTPHSGCCGQSRPQQSAPAHASVALLDPEGQVRAATLTQFILLPVTAFLCVPDIITGVLKIQALLQSAFSVVIAYLMTYWHSQRRASAHICPSINI